ncbi:MAG: LysR substrate-binding domain-containing protein [Ancalomicrobiaceae bacterium]|nr:LysR substrate-binding domain-containing protein [Ancalomicrobiaceae bacterium]
MEVRQLQHFIAVAEERQFTRAAQRMNIVQSALSSSIRSLETELQARLFVRNTRQVQLTPAGHAFLDKARDVVRTLDQARQVVADVEGLKTGSLAIGTVHSLPAFLDLPSLIARFHRANPGIEVRLRQGDMLGLLEQLRGGQLDLAFLPLLDPPEEFVTGIVACDDLVVVVPKGHELAGRSNLPLSELCQYPFVDFDVRWGTRPLIDRAFSQAGVSRHSAFEVTDLETLVDLVARGLGIALLPEAIAEARSPSVSSAQLGEPAICWELVVAHARNAGDKLPVNGAAREFMTLLTVA